MSTQNIKTPSQLVTAAQLESVTAFLPERSTFKGDLTADEGCDQGIKIDCIVEGSIIIPTGGVIHIGPNGKVKGALISADYIYIEGSVESNILARKGVELTGTSMVKGRVDYHGSLNVHNTAKVHAAIHYSTPDAAQP